MLIQRILSYFIYATIFDAPSDAPFVKVFRADLPNIYANNAPQTTIPADILVTPYRPDIVIFNTKC